MAAESGTARDESLQHALLDTEDSELISQDAGDEYIEERPVARLPSESAEYATFSLRHGLQDADPNLLSLVVKVGGLALTAGAVWAVQKLLRRQRLDVSNAWAWTVPAPAPSSDHLDLAKPLMGTSLVVAENLPVQGHTPICGAAAWPEAEATHPYIRLLCDSGATLRGASRVDVTRPHTPAACGTCRNVGNPGHPGRVVLGEHGAACALVAAGEASLAIGVDSGGGMLMAAACNGLYALRFSQIDGPFADVTMIHPTTACTSAAIAIPSPDNVLKIAKALKLPGQLNAPEELRVMLAADLFVMTESVAREKVTNGIVTRAITTWLSDREHARQVELLTWLAKEVQDWVEFAPKPRGTPDPEQVLLAISAAHKTIEDYEWQNGAPSPTGWMGRDEEDAALEPPVEKEAYDNALRLRMSVQNAMRKALPPAVLMVLPVLAGAAPKIKSYKAPLDKQAASMAVLSQHFMALVAMSGCPAAVLPVPALNKKGAPWAVLMLGSQKHDTLLAKYASKMGAHIRKTAAAIADEMKAERDGTKSNGAVQPLSAAERETQSDSFKVQGNSAFKAGNFPEAIALYSAALELTPNSNVLYSNRAQAYISLQRYELAVQDCESSLRCKFSVKAALRRGTACQALGLWQEAADSFRAVLQREAHNLQAQNALRDCKMALQEIATTNVEINRENDSGAVDESVLL